jgi:hypothetical protein
MHKWTKNAKQKNKGPKEKQVAWELSSWMKNNKTFGLQVVEESYNKKGARHYITLTTIVLKKKKKKREEKENRNKNIIKKEKKNP